MANPHESELHYPFGDAVPAPGEVRDIAPGVRWLRMGLPFALDHINLWLLADRIDGVDGWTIVDCGVTNDATRAAWEQVFKRELLYIPFFGWAMGRLDMIHIDRSKRLEAWARIAARGKELFAQGIWVIMFPEGTRTERGHKGRYQSGASRLAITCGVPIVPIAVTSAKCWPRKSFLLRPGVILSLIHI